LKIKKTVGIDSLERKSVLASFSLSYSFTKYYTIFSSRKMEI